MHKGLSLLPCTHSLVHSHTSASQNKTLSVPFRHHSQWCWHSAKNSKLRAWPGHFRCCTLLWDRSRVVPLLDGQSGCRPVAPLTRDCSAEASAECWCTVCLAHVLVHMMDDMRWCTGSKWLGETEDAQFTYSPFALLSAATWRSHWGWAALLYSLGAFGFYCTSFDSQQNSLLPAQVWSQKSIVFLFTLYIMMIFHIL